MIPRLPPAAGKEKRTKNPCCQSHGEPRQSSPEPQEASRTSELRYRYYGRRARRAVAREAGDRYRRWVSRQVRTMQKEAKSLSQRSHEEQNTMEAVDDVIRPEMMQQETRNTRAADSVGLLSSSAVVLWWWRYSPYCPAGTSGRISTLGSSAAKAGACIILHWDRA